MYCSAYYRVCTSDTSYKLFELWKIKKKKKVTRWLEWIICVSQTHRHTPKKPQPFHTTPSVVKEILPVMFVQVKDWDKRNDPFELNGFSFCRCLQSVSLNLLLMLLCRLTFSLLILCIYVVLCGSYFSCRGVPLFWCRRFSSFWSFIEVVSYFCVHCCVRPLQLSGRMWCSSCHDCRPFSYWSALLIDVHRDKPSDCWCAEIVTFGVCWGLVSDGQNTHCKCMKSHTNAFNLWTHT